MNCSGAVLRPCKRLNLHLPNRLLNVQRHELCPSNSMCQKPSYTKKQELALRQAIISSGLGFWKGSFLIPAFNSLQPMYNDLSGFSTITKLWTHLVGLQDSHYL